MSVLSLGGYCTAYARVGDFKSFKLSLSSATLIQIEVVWMYPAGPGRSDNCRPVNVFAPPPLPIQVIIVTFSHTMRLVELEDFQEMTVSARSASLYFSDNTMYTWGSLLGVGWELKHACLRDLGGEINIRINIPPNPPILNYCTYIVS